jgi:C-terminal processing protease CtpA/Prc
MMHFIGKRPDPRPLGEKDFQSLAQIIETKYVGGKLRTWCTGKIAYGVLPHRIGYLRISGFGVYTQDRNFTHSSAALDEALDAIFQESQKWRGLIIDVRVNRGGSDVNGLAVASRLATSEYLGFIKRARNDPDSAKAMTPPQESRVPVSGRPRFGGNVVLLTSRYTISAGETFTMALMGRTPRIIRVGENTQGIFSDILWRDLPNGFSFSLPNEVYLSKSGITFEGPGISPDFAIAAFPQDAGKADNDLALEKAIDILSEDKN